MAGEDEHREAKQVGAGRFFGIDSERFPVLIEHRELIAGIDELDRDNRQADAVVIAVLQQQDRRDIIELEEMKSLRLIEAR